MASVQGERKFVRQQEKYSFSTPSLIKTPIYSGPNSKSRKLVSQKSSMKDVQHGPGYAHELCKNELILEIHEYLPVTL